MPKTETYAIYTEIPKRLVCQIHRPTRKGTYYLLKPEKGRRGQYEYVDKITLSGFTSLPSGLRRDGAGLPSSGYLLLKYLSEKFGAFKLAIDNSGQSGLQNQQVVLNHGDLRGLLRQMRTIKAERFAEMSLSALD